MIWSPNWRRRLRRQALVVGVAIFAVAPIHATHAQDSGNMLPAEGAQPSAEPSLGTSLNARVSGEYRLRLDAYSNPGVIDRTVPDFVALQNRAFLRVDVGTDRIRAVAEIAGGLQSGREPASFPGDRGVELQQAYFAYSHPLGSGIAQLRIGRQPLVFGSTRFFSARDGTNIRRAFDGARVTWNAGSSEISAFAAQPVRNKPDIFNDDREPGEWVWGLYAQRIPQPVVKELDLYYAGLSRDHSAFAQGTEDETRHSLGVRARHRIGSWEQSFEGVYQFGSFGRGDISAFFVAAEVGYTFEAIPLRPKLLMRGGVISGDTDPSDADLQTFNPLFPNTSFFTKAALFGPANAVEVYPRVRIQATKDVDLTFGTDFFWRYSRADALYRPPALPRIDPKLGSSRYIGPLHTIELNWRVRPAITFGATYAYAQAGPFVREAGGRSVHYGLVELSTKF